MELNRVESFSDGVIAVIITVMVLEFKVPADATLASLQKMLPQFFDYLLSFVTVAIMWSNHHHLLKGARKPDARLLWTNSHLLFWMSLCPFVTAYMSAHPFEPIPVATYGVAMAMMSVGFTILRHAILAQRYSSRKHVSTFQYWMFFKNVLSAAGYVAAIGFAFVNVWISYALYLLIPASYFLPDPSLAVEQTIQRETGY